MTTNRRRTLGLNQLISHQRAQTIKPADSTQPSVTVETDTDVVSTEENESVDSKIVKETEFGDVRRGTFSISVKEGTGDKAKILYENKAEPFEYETVNSLVNALRHSGAQFTDTQIDGFTPLLTSDDEEVDKTLREAVMDVLKVINAKLKADAKSSAYQALVNKYKPLEGEKRETAIARTIVNMIKLSGASKEVAIEALKGLKAIPADYTVADFDSTPLRRTKGESEDED